jgi:hypothetical protein
METMPEWMPFAFLTLIIMAAWIARDFFRNGMKIVGTVALIALIPTVMLVTNMSSQW